MGRIPKGEKPKTRSQLLGAYRERLKSAGGRRLLVDVGPDVSDALDHLLGADASTTIKDAVSGAIIDKASRKGWKPKAST